MTASSTASCSGAFWRGIRFRPASSAVQAYETSDFQDLFEELGVNLDADGISAWLDCDSNICGVQVFSDTEICDLVSRSTDPDSESEDEEKEFDVEEEKCPVSNSDAAFMFEQCLSWLEHQPEANTYNTTLLRELHSLAAVKRIDSLKQTSIKTYFQAK